MNKTLIVVLNLCIIAVILFVLLIVVYPFIRYNNMESTTLNIWIVDKTVPNPDYREHTGLLWLLNSLKIYNEKTGTAFDYSEDYYGFFPIDENNWEIKDIPNVVEKPDLIYLADTYGVYVDDYLKDNRLGTKSAIMYGGIQEYEADIIKANLGNGNTIIGEFNIAQEPTYQAAARELGEIFASDWTNWCGRYFYDLSEGVEVPVWAVAYYEQETGREWDFSGEGFILVNNFYRIVVFEKGIDFGNDYVYMTFLEDTYDEFGIKGDIPYEYWFEFTEPYNSAEILAEFTFDVTEQGEKKLNDLGLTSVFPAIFRNKNKIYTSYYFAGDFADGVIHYKWWNYYGLSGIKRVFPMGEKGDNKRFYWKCYVPMMEKIMSDINITTALEGIEKYTGDLQYNVKTTENTFQFKTDSGFEDMFIKGVNMGSSTPGNWFTQFSNNEDLYLEWFEQIGAMNANTIRVYTLLSPQFYSALAHYNETHPDNILWLYQEIWPEENPEDKDYLKQEYVDDYLDEIKNVVDALNGHNYIPYRKYRASGIYTSDVSEYVAGYLVGRELEPEEVLSTNLLNEGYNYNGTYFYCSEDASPTEAWLAMCCDYLIDYETTKYNWQHPVGIVSWPLLDVAEHNSEWNAEGDKSKVYNDMISLDINNINVNDNLKTGFFGAYHIYPNYPDFMNNEASYALYQDDEGTFRYGGYLQEFMQTHTKYPALVAEFGLATGMSIAHSNPDGYSHGGMTEKEQGEGIVRMVNVIKDENYAGAIIFEWADEWAKKTWNTESYIIPFDRNVLWHSMVDPEQNYGIMAMEANTLKSGEYIITGNDKVSKIKLSSDEEYLHLQIELSNPLDFESESLSIGLDTFDRESGNFMFPNNNYYIAPFGLEFLIEIKGMDSAYILVNPSYNTNKGRYESAVTYSGKYDNILQLVNMERITKDGEVIEEIYFDNSKLNFGDFTNNSFYSWNMSDNIINIRLPWLTLNFCDPSEMRVLDDDETIYVPLREQIKTTITDGIMVCALIFDTGNNKLKEITSSDGMPPFSWKKWDVPDYNQRAKQSYDIIAEYFGEN